MLMSYFYTPWKRQKTFGFLTFSGGIEMGHWREKDYWVFLQILRLILSQFKRID